MEEVEEVKETASRSAVVSALTCSGASMFGPNSVTPAKPRDSASRIQRGAERPGNGGMRMASASRARAGSAPVSSVGHPFTAPATRPARRRRWTSRKKARTGTVNSVEAAMIAPQSAPFRP